MALRTNSKKVREKIRKWICDNFDGSGYILENIGDSFNDIAKNIYDVFKSESYEGGNHSRMSESERFVEWCLGLPCVLDTASYCWNGSAVETLGDILEETEKERNRFTETDAEKLFSNLIFREIERAKK